MATTTDIAPEEQRALDEIRTRLTEKFPHADAATVDSAVSEAHQRFDDPKIRDFIPLFVERHAASVLAGE
ncbi:three-helix bundle dimerization domain-containing protein [Rhodococcoides kyotonense]|uniref:Uncharacterized protein n=1 Tax=Rhodococcoides kyotonense TaxID=398843 RepID=A0A239LJL2_9NOCA|nr:hypothetical protein [Rhodococcus kyotonensis]SNT29859.1 hypothetical protein SAMN05421642_11360 [Rhodococcus kyotonensis]